MNKKIAKTLLVLCVVYMLGFYLLKYIFPEKFILYITDANILTLGKFIESNIIVTYITYFISGFLTFYLFTCASTGTFKIKLRELITIIICTIINILVTTFLPEFMAHISTCLMFICAYICNGKYKYSIISFTIHGIMSQLLFSIRGFETILINYNMATGLVLSLECFMWLVILSLIFNISKKEV